MLTIVFAASKGGVGKTTLATAMAVEAARAHAVALYDCDPQQSATRWFELRDEPGAIQLIDWKQARVAPADAVKLARARGAAWLMIDTPPGIHRLNRLAIEVASLVVVPVKPSPIDLEAVDATVEMCRQINKPFLFVLNMVPAQGALTQEAATFLAQHGPVADTAIRQRQAWLAAPADGKSGAEIDKTKACAKEARALWRTIAKATRPAVQ